MHQGLEDIFGEAGKKIVTHHAEDGSGVGSAIITGKLRFNALHPYLGLYSMEYQLTLLSSYDARQEGQRVLQRVLGDRS